MGTEKDKPPPAFLPPKPTVADGLLTLLRVLEESLGTEAFKKSLFKCFVQVGLQEEDDETFVKYSYNKKGFLTRHIPQAATSAEGVSVAEIASEIALTSRPDDADAESGSEEGDSDGDSDGDE